MDRATEALAGLDWSRLEALAEELQEIAASGAMLLATHEITSRQRVFQAVTQATKVNRNVLARICGDSQEQIWER